MSLVNEGNGNMVMPVGPMYGNGNGGFGWGGDGSFWIIILFLFAMFGGWGNGFGFGNGGGMMPYMMNNTTNNDVQRGFDQQAVMGSLNGINSALANAEVSRCNAQANILQTLNQNQSAVNQAMNSVAMSLQNCCCENRALVSPEPPCDFFRLDSGLGGNVCYAHALTPHEGNLKIVCSHDFDL